MFYMLSVNAGLLFFPLLFCTDKEKKTSLQIIRAMN